MRENLIVGTILKPQGIRGELKVKPYTDFPEDFKEFKNLYLDGEKRRVLSVRVGDGMVFLGLSGVPDRNAAELLRGKNLELDRDEAPEPGGRTSAREKSGARPRRSPRTRRGEILHRRSFGACRRHRGGGGDRNAHRHPPGGERHLYRPKGRKRHPLPRRFGRREGSRPRRRPYRCR